MLWVTTTSARRLFVPVAAALLLLFPLATIGGHLSLFDVAHANPGPAEEFTEDADENLPSLEFVLARFVEASGGRDAVSALGTRVAEVRVVNDLSSRTPPVYEVDTLSVYSDADGAFLMVYRTPGGTVIQGFDGEERWKIEENGNVVFDPAWGPRDAWLTDPQFSLHLTELFPHLAMAGVETPDGRWSFAVDFDSTNSHPVRRLYFDEETGLLTRLGWNREVRDYREVDGVMVPVEVSLSRKGGSTTYYVDSVEHNVKLDREMFSLAK